MGRFVTSSGAKIMPLFLEKYLNEHRIDDVVHTDFNLTEPSDSLPKKTVHINLKRLNKNPHISKYFHNVNRLLEKDGIFIGCLQTHRQQKEARWINKIPVVRSLVHGPEFIFHRVFPKVNVLNRIYFFLTGGRSRRLTKTEILGRLVRYGFDIVEVKENIDNKLYFVVRKDNDGNTVNRPSYGPLYKMARIGKDGKIIHVYKFRTMHPYSEYLQDYILKNNGYASSGKPANDFRLTSWGKVMRKYWLDEIPQLINVIKGDMKLIGVRPVSQRYFQDIPTHIQTLRLVQKPGCIPPYVALNRASSKDSVLNSEEIYLRLSKHRTKRIDTAMAFLAVRNIVFKGKRSA